MRSLGYFAALALVTSACAHGLTITEVKVPIPVPCATEVPNRPGSAWESLDPDDPAETTVFESVQALLVDRERMGAYASELEALIEACR